MSTALPPPPPPHWPQRPGRRRLSIGRILVFGIVGVIGLGGLIGNASRDSEGRIVEAGTVDAVAIQVGDCFTDPPTGTETFTEINAVPCTEPHDAEIYLVFDHPAGDDAPLPPQSEFDAMLADRCLTEFDHYVGLAYELSDLDVYTIFPTGESWPHGDRELACAAYPLDGSPLVGSVQGSRR